MIYFQFFDLMFTFPLFPMLSMLLELKKKNHVLQYPPVILLASLFVLNLLFY